jgi:LysM repeat protein
MTGSVIMNRGIRKGGWLVLLMFAGMTAFAKEKNISYVKYIQTYSKMALQQQKKYRIPASITLAQGVLESGAGQSELARKSNNHFGIKCGRDWQGKSVSHDDDLPGECFRKYGMVQESYEDHSLFLTTRAHYSDLFKLKITDYKGWAKGLQKAGYATDRSYAEKLIRLIEDYELHRFDSGKGIKKEEQYPALNRMVYKTYGLIYVLALPDDSFEQIAGDMGFKAKALRKYNEAPERVPLRQGDIVYLQKKKKKAGKPYVEHVVRGGESMYSISQGYGIRVKNLYKLNKKPPEYVPREGDILKLR